MASLRYSGNGRGEGVVAQNCCPASIPAPFDRYTDVEVIHQVYPNFDPRTRLLGRGVVDEAGHARGGMLCAAKLWKGEGDSKFLSTGVSQESGVAGRARER
jgi:hypothetical protein